MDITTLIIGFISLALFILPIFYIQGKQKNKKKKLLNDFARLAQQHQLSISELDSWNHRFVIGIDAGQGKLLYLKAQEDKEHVVVVNLTEVEACSVSNMHRDVNSNRVIDLIGLRFRLRGPKHPEQTLEFYNKEDSLSLSDELMLSEKWCALVNAHLQGIHRQPLTVRS